MNGNFQQKPHPVLTDIPPLIKEKEKFLRGKK